MGGGEFYSGPPPKIEAIKPDPDIVRLLGQILAINELIVKALCSPVRMSPAEPK